MSKDSIMDFLFLPKNIYRRILDVRERIIALRQSVLPRGIRYDTDPVQTSPTDPMPEYAANLDELERELDKLIEAYHRAMGEVYETICNIPDLRVRVVMTKHYVRGKSWPVVAEECQVSRRTALRQNRTGLGFVGISLDEKNSHSCACMSLLDEVQLYRRKE